MIRLALLSILRPPVRAVLWLGTGREWFHSALFAVVIAVAYEFGGRAVEHDIAARFWSRCRYEWQTDEPVHWRRTCEERMRAELGIEKPAGFK